MSRLFIACALLTGCVGAEPDDPTTSSDESAITQAIQHLKVYTVDTSGAPYTPRVGDEDIVQIEFDIATATPQMEIDLTFADKKAVTTFPASNPGHMVWAVPFGKLSLDGGIAIGAVVGVNSEINGNPPTVSNGRVVVAGFDTATPASEVEYFDQQTLVGSQTMQLTTAPGSSIIFEAAATTGGDGQSTVADSATIGDSSSTYTTTTTYADANPNKLPLFITYGALPQNNFTFEQDFTVTVSNQRVDHAKLEAITWADYANDIANNSVHAYYTQPESVVQSNDPRILAFINSTLGATYKSLYSPYDAARRMFSAIIARSTYVLPPAPGQRDLRAQSAVDMLLTPQGDCGSFTMLTTAVFRAMGIPARSTAGAWVGDNAGHAWTEWEVPGTNEWIIADGAMAKLAGDPTGGYVYYFGAATDRNIRMTQSRGNTFTFPDTTYTANWLQGPSYWMTNGSVISQTGTTHIAISE